MYVHHFSSTYIYVYIYVCTSLYTYIHTVCIHIYANCICSRFSHVYACSTCMYSYRPLCADIQTLIDMKPHISSDIWGFGMALLDSFEPARLRFLAQLRHVVPNWSSLHFSGRQRVLWQLATAVSGLEPSWKAK